jgi:hypothetical protein
VIPARLGAAGLALLLGAGCAGVRVAGGPASRPAEREGWRVYAVGALSFEAPAGWEASGDAQRLALVPPGGSARLEAWVARERGASAAACLAAVEASLKERDAGLARVQRHPSTLGGHPALAQEADQGATHGWASVACDGPVPHWLTFTGRSPVGQQLLEDWRAVVLSARVGGGP